jgi:uncharacterized RDD family membrane protein YckC
MLQVTCYIESRRCIIKNQVDGKINFLKLVKIFKTIKTRRRYRTIVQRMAAAFIDGIIFFLISLILDKLVDKTDKPGFLRWTILYTVILTSYSVYMHGKYGQTLGKMASKVKVFSKDELNVIGYRRAFYRELIWLFITLLGMLYLMFQSPLSNAITTETMDKYGKFIFWVFMVSMVAEVTTMFLNSKRRSLHDLLASSVVVDVTKYRKWDIEYEDIMREANEQKPVE